MSATMTATKLQMAEWVKVFPRNVTKCFISSMNFVKQLTVVAISTITHLKGIFPNDSYNVDILGGNQIRILKQKCNDELANFVSASLAQAFEAIDKKYLDSLALCFYVGENKAENLIECYTFEYTYNSGGVSVELRSELNGKRKVSTKHTMDSVQENTVLLIKACALMVEESNCYNDHIDDINLRLYYNDNAPSNYQAPGYIADVELEDHVPPAVQGIKLRNIETPFHKFKMRYYSKETLSISQEVISSHNAPKLSEDSFDNIVAESNAKEPLKVQCLCNRHIANNVDANMLILCNYCNTYHHALCYGIGRSVVSKVFYLCCATCHDQDPTRKPTDDTFVPLGAKQRECLAVLRQTLDLCSQMESISITALTESVGISHISAAKAMKLLERHGITNKHPQADFDTPRKIIQDELVKMTRKYYQTEKFNIVERLLEESLSQEQPDPVGEILGPLERTNLMDATTQGRLADTDQRINTAEDPTMKEYRNAILFDQNLSDEVPLSGTHNPVQDIEGLRKRGTKRQSITNTSSKIGTLMKKRKSTSK